MLSTRSIARPLLLQSTIVTYKPIIRTFHQTAANMVKVGDSIPNVDLVEGSPGDKVNLHKELASGKGLIIGVPAAFSKSQPPPSTYLPTYLPTYLSTPASFKSVSKFPHRYTHAYPIHHPGPSCSATHIPGYISSDKLKNAGKTFVVSVNDPFV